MGMSVEAVISEDRKSWFENKFSLLVPHKISGSSEEKMLVDIGA